MTRKHLIPIALLGALLVPNLASAGGKDRVEIDLSFPIALLARLGGTMTMECDTHVDSDSREMIRTLRRTNRYERRDGDDRVVAWKLGDRFKMKAIGDDGDTFILEMPWPAAECILGGIGGRRKIEMEALERSGGFELRVVGEDGEVKVAVD